MQIRCAKCMKVIPGEYKVCPFCGHLNENNNEDTLFLKSGTKIRNRYIVGEVLGYGGFGATYVGWDEMLEQKVAIKEYFPSELSTRKPGQTELSVFAGEKSEYFYSGLKKYLNEARTMAKLENIPHIVGVKEYFEENNTAYIVMEFVDGVTLKEHMKNNGVLSVNDTVRLFLPLINSLEKVHSWNIVHRDISPDNIMLTNNGLKIIDFGAAREVLKNDDKSLSIVLKQGYAPEEQYYKSGKQGPWTDVYALCATMYKCITGETPPQVFERLSHDELVPPSKKGIVIAPNIEKAILKGLEVKIENRFQSMKNLSNALSASDTTEAYFWSDEPDHGGNKTLDVVDQGSSYIQDIPTFYRGKPITEDPVSINIGAGMPAVAEKKKHKSSWLIIMLAAVIIVAVVVSGIFLFGNSSKNKNDGVSTTTTISQTHYVRNEYYDDETQTSETETETTETETSTEESIKAKTEQSTTSTKTEKSFEVPNEDKNEYDFIYNNNNEIIGVKVKIWGTYDDLGHNPFIDFWTEDYLEKETNEEVVKKYWEFYLVDDYCDYTEKIITYENDEVLNEEILDSCYYYDASEITDWNHKYVEVAIYFHKPISDESSWCICVYDDAFINNTTGAGNREWAY